ncbi:MAG: ABC-2 family transporter protein [Clostridia bacterium]|nr:ABC-2 family transporter protein [Clostridia bacterium]
MRYLLHMLAVNLRREMQYRLSFFLSVLSQAVMTLGDLMAILLLLERFRSLGRWEGAEILFFFGAMQLSFALAQTFGRGVEEFSGRVREGSFDTLLVRPRALFVQTMLMEADPRRIINGAIGITALAVASGRLGLHWTGGRVLQLSFSVLSAFSLILGLFTLEASISFFTVDSIEMVNVLTYGGKQACSYPVDIYPAMIRTLFTVIPLALCLHQPISMILGKPIYSSSMPVTLLCLLAGPAFLALMQLAWRAGVRHYRSTGT